MSENGADWAKIQAEYVNSSVSLPQLAEKYGVPISTLRKRSAGGKWSEKRKRYAEKTAERVSEKLHDREVRQTVRDIERVCKAAGKLIDKANLAISQLDKKIYISRDEQEIKSKEEQKGDFNSVTVIKSRKMRTAQAKTAVNTKQLAEIAKALLNIKEVLTGETGEADNTESSGVIEIAAATVIDPREEEHEDDLETAAEAGGDDGARRG